VLAVNITTPGETSLIVVTIYRPPLMSMKETWSQLENVFVGLTTGQFGPPSPTVITGDLNIDLSVKRTKYQALLDDYSLCQFIQYPKSVH
jgi:hypothetical protein